MFWIYVLIVIGLLSSIYLFYKALKALPPRWRKTKDGKGKVDSALPVRKFYIRAYEQAEKDIVSLIESRIKEIMGDAQPNPVLRLELQSIINKIKENGNSISNP